MEISSDSSDTVILSPRLSPVSHRLSANDDINEPSDSEVENILKKYSSDVCSNEPKEISRAHNACEEVICLGEEVTCLGEAIDIPPKRLKTSKKISSNLYRSKIGKIGDILGECSSDSDNSVQNDYKFNPMTSGKINEDCDDMLKVLYSKYLSTSETQSDKISKKRYPKHNNSEVIDLISSEPVNSGGTVNLCLTSGDDSDDLQTVLPKRAAKTRRRKRLHDKQKEKAHEKEKKQAEIQQRKALRNMEKERKKAEVERQKAMKDALKTVEQSSKPSECVKHMLVEMDLEISKKVYVEGLKTMLKNNEISFKFMPQVVPNLILWYRKVQTVENMIIKSSEVKEKQFLLVMDDQDFIKHTKANSLLAHIRNVMKLTQCKQLTLSVFGVGKATGDQGSAIAEIQLLTRCYFRFVKNPEDLMGLVMELTKAIAQIPYKLKKEEKFKLQSEYFNDMNKDTVGVDKNGNGLGRLWHQMLTMFPLARLETAEALTAVYPTPKSLFEAYDSCQTKKEELLQDLPIRRAHGPTASARRIGPELSRKCYNFFTAEENILI